MAAHPGKVWVGVDIGGTNLRFALVDENGSLLLRDRQRTEINLGRESFIDRLIAGIDGMRQGAATLGSEVRAFGSLLLLTLGTGVGSGLVLNGRLWTGIDGVAAEYGHATVEPDGIPCHCGNRGCLEQYASASALVAAALKAVDEGEGGALAGLSRDAITAELVADAARQRDPLAATLIERAGRYLGSAGATIANLLNLEAIVLGGGMSASFDLLAEPMRREIAGRAFAVPARRIRIVKGELGDDAGILGAAALAGELIIHNS